MSDGGHGIRPLKAQRRLLIVESPPETLFRIDRVREQDGVVSSSMPTGPWLERTPSHISAGALGVLADDVMGYAVLVDRPDAHWSVSSEISIDICQPVHSGSTLFAEGRMIHSDVRGALTSGRVVDDQGRIVAVGRQHGRYVDRLPPVVESNRVTGSGPAPASGTGPEPASVFDLVDAHPVVRAAGQAVINLEMRSILANPLGNMHGGVTICLTDLAATTALESTGEAFATGSIHVAYLRPIPEGTQIRVEATTVHLGRSFGVARVAVVRADGKLCATALVSANSR